jgi:hypothetical protein
MDFGEVVLRSTFLFGQLISQILEKAGKMNQPLASNAVARPQ